MADRLKWDGTATRVKDFDRSHAQRGDKVWLSSVQTSSRAFYIIFCGLDPLVAPCGTADDEEQSISSPTATMEVCKFSYDQMVAVFGNDCFISKDPFIIFLGIKTDEDPKYYFACSFSKDNVKLMEEVRHSSNVQDSSFYTMRIVAAHCSLFDSALLVQARPLVDWNNRYKFCGTCGSSTQSIDSGHKRTCENGDCLSNRGVHNTCFPRTDPAVIMLVISPDRKHCLLGRKMIYTTGVYSCLSGFVEPGETMEDAVRREVKEESSVVVERVQYVDSQPWPFPSVLMLGCFAWATTTEIVVDHTELEDARWFSKVDILDVLTNPSSSVPFVFPPPYTLANQLMKAWAHASNDMSSL